MRIIAGSAKGRRLKAPRGQQIRPTADRVRQTVFDVLGQWLEGERVLDLFAGTGALGLEALSRGAERAVLVDSGREATELCEENARALGFEDRVRVLRQEVSRALPQLAAGAERFTLCFADPPYGLVSGGEILGLLERHPVLAPGARVVIEHRRKEQAPEELGPFTRVETRPFGDTAVSFFTKRLDVS